MQQDLLKKLLLACLFLAYLFTQSTELNSIESLLVANDLPYFLEKEQAVQRTNDLKKAVDDIDEKLDNGTTQLELQKIAIINCLDTVWLFFYWSLTKHHAFDLEANIGDGRQNYVASYTYKYW